MNGTTASGAQQAYEDLLVEREAQVTTITLNRPERLNAISGPMLSGLSRALREAEVPLLTRLLEALAPRADVRVLGPTTAAARAATVAIVPMRVTPQEAGRRLAEHGFMVGYGDFYAVRLLEALGVDPARGALRFSLLHYTTLAEVDGLIAQLDAALSP